MYLCWGAQAGLYYHYGIPKYKRDKKLSGIYEHQVLHHKVPLVRGMDDFVMAPHSRYTEVLRRDIEKHPELNILVESREAGVFLVMKSVTIMRTMILLADRFLAGGICATRCMPIG